MPVRLQLNSVECGAACLAMVLSYFGKHTTVSQCRQHCAGGRGGVNARTIGEAARAYGLTFRGVRASPAVFRELRMPVIAHWAGKHFVVVERWTPRRVDIVDPEWGRRRLTPAEFEEGLGDAVLVLEPGPDFVRSRRAEDSTLALLVRMVARMPRARAAAAQILTATIVLQAFGLALPVAMMLIVDEIFGRDSRTMLVAVLGIALGVTIVAQVLAGYLRALLLIYLRGRIDWHVLSAFVEHLYRLPLRYFHQRTSGDIAARIASISVMRDLLANQTITSVLDAALVIGYVVFMYLFDPVLATAVIVILAAQILMTAMVSGRARDLTARNVAAKVSVQDYLLQTLASVGTIKATGAEPHVVAGLKERIVGWTSSALHRGHLDARVDTFSGMLRMLAPLLVLWLGAWRVLDGQLSVGTLLGFVWLSAAVLGPMSALVMNWQRFQGATVQLERLGDVLRAEPELVGDGMPPAGHVTGAKVELRDVSFSYDRHEAPAVSGISVTIEPGQRVAIVGRSGAGKTTLAMLVLGLYEPSSGEICHDGVPLRELNLPRLRRRFGVVLQEPFTMRGTVRDNIAFTHPDASDEDVRWAARIADVDLEIGRLPLGYDTRLAERGIGLSGGQLQRLSIARALVGRPALLVLDEATSYLDAETERRIVAGLEEVACTQLVIAHRLSTVRDADLILVLHDGQIVESGTHVDLIDRGGPYAALVSAQLAGAAKADESRGLSGAAVKTTRGLGCK